jgi:hypothetical protein
MLSVDPKDLVDRMGFFLREDYFMYNDYNDLCSG